MPQAAVWVVVALLAILVAAAVPALLQLRRTLATAERTIAATGSRVDAALLELSETLGRVNRAAEVLERAAQDLGSFFDTLRGVRDSVAKVKSSLTSVAAIGASIGPMIYAALRGVFRSDKPEEAVEVKP